MDIENKACYVCEDMVDMDVDQYCWKRLEADQPIRIRHLWHGTPSAVRAIGGGGGFVGYAKTLEQAKERAEYYVHNNPYTAPEVVAEEQTVLDEVIRILALGEN